MTLVPCPVQLIATERYDKTRAFSRPESQPSTPPPPKLLSECKIRLTEHKHLLLESEAAPFSAEIKHCCLHATMNNEAITSDRQATAL